MGKFYSVRNTSGTEVMSGSLTIPAGAVRELYLEDDAVGKFRQIGTAEEDNSIESAVDVNGMMQNNPNVTKKKGKSNSTEKETDMSTPKDASAGDPNATQQQPVNSSGPNVTAPGAGGPTVSNPTPDNLTTDSADDNSDDKSDKSKGKDTAKAKEDNSKKK